MWVFHHPSNVAGRGVVDEVLVSVVGEEKGVHFMLDGGTEVDAEFGETGVSEAANPVSVEVPRIATNAPVSWSLSDFEW